MSTVHTEGDDSMADLDDTVVNTQSSKSTVSGIHVDLCCLVQTEH